jgi:hypothetical protein
MKFPQEAAFFFSQLQNFLSVEPPHHLRPIFLFEAKTA